MDNFKFDDGIEMVRVGDDDSQYDGKLTSKQIESKKKISRLISAAREKTKLQKCFMCGKECSSFCDSHSIPKFVLRIVAEDGMISEALQGKMLFYEKSIGVNKAGTFNIICKNCDNEEFQEYENADAYLKEPTNIMLAQIALKNYLKLIDKKLILCEMFRMMGKKYPESKEFADEKEFLEQQDLDHYIIKYKYARKATKLSDEKHYHLCYYQELDYVVPYAVQTAITLVGGFDDEVINNVYIFSSENDIKEIHIAIFPLETRSVVMLFVEEGEKRYRKFYRKLNKLPFEDQLATINYIVFAYTEEVYINPKAQKAQRDNRFFSDACQLTTDTLSHYNSSPQERIAKAVKEFSLSKRHDFPNLLSREYAISSDNKDE